MSEAPWPHRPPPDTGSAASTVWAGPATPADVTALRKRLRTAVAEGLAPACDTGDDDRARLLLAFEELTSNALRHGRPPVRVAVTPTATGWLLDVSDAATDRPPMPAVGRDPADGGLGLHLIARLAAAVGWLIEGDRKRVWAQLVCMADGRTDGVAGRLRDMVTGLTTSLAGQPAIRVTGPVDDLREDMVIDLFAVLQEALTNVVRHARARTADVDITVASGTVTLQVVDDGIGMQAAPRDGGLGDLRRRATWHGGTLLIGPGRAGGTRLVWRVPDGGRPSGPLRALGDARRPRG
jgi:signal transduction histidine kinase